MFKRRRNHLYLPFVLELFPGKKFLLTRSLYYIITATFKTRIFSRVNKCFACNRILMLLKFEHKAYKLQGQFCLLLFWSIPAFLCSKLVQPYFHRNSDRMSFLSFATAHIKCIYKYTDYFSRKSYKMKCSERERIVHSMRMI